MNKQPCCQLALLMNTMTLRPGMRPPLTVEKSTPTNSMSCSQDLNPYPQELALSQSHKRLQCFEALEDTAIHSKNVDQAALVTGENLSPVIWEVTKRPSRK